LIWTLNAGDRAASISIEFVAPDARLEGEVVATPEEVAH
jgi:hypothetical protein